MRRIFSINPKSYLYGGELLELALYADKLAEGKNLDVFFTVPYVYIQQLVQNTKHLIITAQEMDPIQSGQRHPRSPRPPGTHKASFERCPPPAPLRDNIGSK